MIHYWGGHESTAAYLTTHENTAEFCTSTLNRAELATGLAATDRLDPAVVDERFGWVRAVPFRTEHAQEAGRIEAELRANEGVEGRQIAELKTDIYVAATAVIEDATVVTRNTKDFERLGVSAEAY